MCLRQRCEGPCAKLEALPGSLSINEEASLLLVGAADAFQDLDQKLGVLELKKSVTIGFIWSMCSTAQMSGADMCCDQHARLPAGWCLCLLGQALYTLAMGQQMQYLCAE